jgi:chromosome partitioning protein
LACGGALGTITAVINNKGGVGKTTVTCNLAHALGLEGRRVLVVDLDSQCNTTQLLFPQAAQPRTSLYELLAKDHKVPSLSDYIYSTCYDNVFCLPNVPETAALEPQLIVRAPESIFRLRQLLRDHAIENFDFTLIDNPPNIGTFVLCALHAADFVVVPVKAGSAFSVAGLLQAVRLINEVRQQGNSDLRFLRLLVNQVDRRTSISRAITTQLADTFRQDQIFKTSIPVNTLFEQSEAVGQTLLEFSPNAAGSQAYRDLAREIMAIFSQSPTLRGRAEA